MCWSHRHQPHKARNKQVINGNRRNGPMNQGKKHYRESKLKKKKSILQLEVLAPDTLVNLLYLR